MHREEWGNSWKVFCCSFILIIICCIACFHIIQSFKKMNVIPLLPVVLKILELECMHLKLFILCVKASTPKQKCVRQILILIWFYWIQRINNIKFEIWWRFVALEIPSDILILRKRLAIAGETWCTELFNFCSFCAKTTNVTKKRFMSNLLQSLENINMHC